MSTPNDQAEQLEATDQAAPQAESPASDALEATAPESSEATGADEAGGEVHDPYKKKPEEIFDRSVTFKDLGLRDSVLKGTDAAGFEHPTAIQAQLIPPALTGRDLIGQAKTGTGKTAAFSLPMLHMCEKDTPMQALILVPTRELAVQVSAEIEELGKHTPIRSTCIIGGESMRHQIKSVQSGGQILVGTPGRVMDLEQRGMIHFDNIKCVVLDEVDRMLDIGFREDIRKILKLCPDDRQTMFVSATISDEIESLARRYMKKDAQKIVTSAGSLTVAMVDQHYLTVEPWDKRSLLLHLLRNEKPDTTVVFCRTKMTVQRITKYLREKDINVRQIHGDMPQAKRNSVMKSLRADNVDVLIASDLAARGLDVEHITHVINYDLPEDPEVYVHRIGRTARAGRKGKAWAFVTREEGDLLTKIESLIGQEIPVLHYPSFKPGRVPKDIAEERAKYESRKSTGGIEKLGDRAAGTSVDELSEEEKQRLFPGGVVPKGKPRRGLGSRFKSRRR